MRYLTKESLGAYFGYQVGSHVAVRHDLPPRARNFVLQHELYHATDEASWGGWIGREIRANAAPALKDPIGALSALVANIPELPSRISLYFRRLRAGS